MKKKRPEALNRSDVPHTALQALLIINTMPLKFDLNKDNNRKSKPPEISRITRATPYIPQRLKEDRISIFTDEKAKREADKSAYYHPANAPLPGNLSRKSSHNRIDLSLAGREGAPRTPTNEATHQKSPSNIPRPTYRDPVIEHKNVPSQRALKSSEK